MGTYSNNYSLLIFMIMSLHHHLVFVFLFVFVNSCSSSSSRVLAIRSTINNTAGLHQNGPNFDQNYNITWGNNHISLLDQGTTVQLLMDKSSGAGFGSRLNYSSGLFHLRMKLPDRDSAGVVTAFYLTSHDNRHDEIDFEFLGNREGKPYDLQTNVFANGVGNREQKTHLWFDPTAAFHTYKILWNPHQIVFFVDTIPIRVYMNNKTLIGNKYPKKPMQIVASLWDGESWATDGGKTKTNWSMAPFKAYFRSFDINGCSSSDTRVCYSTERWWNKVKYWKLSPAQQRIYEAVRKYRTYDYCTDQKRFPVPPPECLVW